MDPDQQRPPPPEAPDKEKMDQIRRRRLEKLSGSSTPAPRSEQQQIDNEGPSSAAAAAPAATVPEAAEEATAPASSRPTINVTKANPADTNSSTPADNPFSKLTARPSPSVSNIQPTSGNLKRLRAESDEQTPQPAALPAALPAPKKHAAPLFDEPIDVYENRILQHIFRITLDPNQKVDASNHKLIFLPKLRQELVDDSEPIMLTKERLDSALLEAGSTIPNSKPILDYLLPSWKRITKALKGLRGYANAKDAILKEAKRLCMSYCIFALEMPDLYGREPNLATDSLTPYLLNEAGEDKGVCPDFITEAVARFGDDDMARSMITKSVAGLSYQLSNLTMNDSYKPYINALKQLVQFNPVVTAIAQDPLFQMATSAPGIEKHTILGPFFRISPLQPEVTREYFAGPKTMDRRHIHTSQEALRLTLQAHQRDLLDIVNRFVRASPESRNKILDWFAYIVNSNHMRRALRPDATQLSSDGFLMNITVVLDGLCEPFMDATFSKVEKIDIDYLKRHPRVDIKEETKLNADQNASDEYYMEEVPGTSNFISEVFFLTLAAHHYGSEATNSMLKTLDKDIKYLTEKIVQLEAERPKFVNSPANMARFEEQLKRFNDVLEKSMSLKLAAEGVLLDKGMQQKSLMFMRTTTVWLLRIASASDYTPDKSLKLPLAETAPDAFRFLPEYVLEDISSNFNFIFRSLPDIMLSAIGDEIIALCITFLTNSEYIKNPYLKAKLVSLMFHGIWPVYHRSKGIIGDSLTGSQFANDYLLHALMKFYIEVESTGAHTQFYDKFNIRYEIFQVIKCIWTNDIYQQRLTQESKTNIQFFLRFVNLLLNDATYVLDEALTKFPKIHDLQGELRQTPSTLTAEQRTAKEEELATAEGQAESYMQLTNETISMMKLFTKTLSSSFTMPEIVDRVAAMVDYTLETIVGPKSTNLVVDHPEKYKFSPKTLLSEFIDIYLNLGVSQNFIEAVARDGRSYKPEVFDRASHIMTKHSLKSPEEVAAWEALKNRFKAVKEADDQDDEDFGEIPEEYLDQIMFSLMKDPVILPTSKAVVDRSTIQGHLLSDPHDPFNRMPLKIEDVIEDAELKVKINAWREEMRSKAKTAREEKMDTTEG